MPEFDLLLVHRDQPYAFICLKYFLPAQSAARVALFFLIETAQNAHSFLMLA